MANYDCTTRTNYFHIKDKDKFEEFMTHIYGIDEKVKWWTKKDDDGNDSYAFGVYGAIDGYYNDPESRDKTETGGAFMRLIFGLQNLVTDDDAVIIMEAGFENLRYVVGSVLVITSKGYERRDTIEIGKEMASKMLNNKNYHTKCIY